MQSQALTLAFSNQDFFNPDFPTMNYSRMKFSTMISSNIWLLASQLLKSSKFENSTNLITFNPMAPQSTHTYPLTTTKHCLGSKTDHSIQPHYLCRQRAKIDYSKDVCTDWHTFIVVLLIKVSKPNICHCSFVLSIRTHHPLHP